MHNRVARANCLVELSGRLVARAYCLVALSGRLVERAQQLFARRLATCARKREAQRVAARTAPALIRARTAATAHALGARGQGAEGARGWTRRVAPVAARNHTTGGHAATRGEAATAARRRHAARRAPEADAARHKADGARSRHEGKHCAEHHLRPLAEARARARALRFIEEGVRLDRPRATCSSLPRPAALAPCARGICALPPAACAAPGRPPLAALPWASPVAGVGCDGASHVQA